MDREKSLEFLKQAVALAKSGQKMEARALLLNAISQNPGNEMAWLWLGSVAETSEEARASLEQALVLNPTHEAAAAWLERLEEGMQGEDTESAPESTSSRGMEDPRRDSQAFAVGFLDLERMEEALSYLQAAADLQPENPRLGNLVAGLQGRLQEAAVLARVSGPLINLGGGVAATSLSSDCPGSGVGRTVLVADGDLGVRQLMARVLGDEEWGVLQTSDGLGAVSCLQQAVPDLILVAADLRQVDGEGICQLVRSNDLTRDIPVVLLEAIGVEPRGAHDTVADIVLGKPIDVSLLKQALWHFFGSGEDS
jgi:CheY-like chemotaxis protein